MFISKWINISFFNLFLVALLGFTLRYKIAFSLPWLDQKNVLHSHSHFAFSGWVSHILMVLLIYYLGLKLGEQIYSRYRLLLYANLITSYGMLISFILQGYAFYSISFSTLSIFVFLLFAIYYWKDLSRISGNPVSHKWFKWALIFGVISALGPFALAYQMVQKLADQDWYLGSVYFFLHFQYNGWFLFAGMGLLADKLEAFDGAGMKLRTAFYLFCAACVPGYFLSVLWMPFVNTIYYLLLAAVFAQLAGWVLILQVVIKNIGGIKNQFSKPGRLLFVLSALAFTIKLILQSGSIHPQLSQLSYGFRPIIIGYLHLVLLGVTTIFILAYVTSLKLILTSKLMLGGLYLFVAGVIINELFLMIQGVAALSYKVVPHIQLLLFGASTILLAGIGILFIASLNRKPLAEKK
ncbi:hypothetical protein [Daejeonella lutea]|uniref:Uncharacterized protein n=1 Tax=Daejeonella lutea TaxID=572036 RepID=A0A1T5A580_9SPHI|nr:hypothetical protein [Daejeonella lutea]SKB30065.1 hypothetical protein SAMN05661099_0328 [Daejeonella lutea]